MYDIILLVVIFMKKYYEAYEERYKQVHEKGVSWTTNNNTKIVDDVINKYHLEKTKMLEIGCGEGRDARYLLSKGYNLLAIDISKEAIKYCKDNDNLHKNNYKMLDVLEENNERNEFSFIYSIACIHMLVLDEDRNKFYQYIYNNLSDDGYYLILSMGDGKEESISDINRAFDKIRRVHQESNQELVVSQTSCRIVNFEKLFCEVKENGFDIIEYGLTEINNHFNKIMYVLIKKL